MKAYWKHYFYWVKKAVYDSLYNMVIYPFLNWIAHTQEKYDKAISSLTDMEKRVKVAESMLEATLQYESGQAKAMSSPRYLKICFAEL